MGLGCTVISVLWERWAGAAVTQEAGDHCYARDFSGIPWCPWPLGGQYLDRCVTVSWKFKEENSDMSYRDMEERGEETEGSSWKVGQKTAKIMIQKVPRTCVL